MQNKQFLTGTHTVRDINCKVQQFHIILQQLACHMHKNLNVYNKICTSTEIFFFCNFWLTPVLTRKAEGVKNIPTYSNHNSS